MALPAAYVGLFEILSKEANKHGYALALHGSLKNDLDVFAMPWVEEAISAVDLVQHLHDSISYLKVDVARDEFAQNLDIFRGRLDGPARRPHGRLSWNIHLGFGCKVDISVMPRLASDETRQLRRHSRESRDKEIYRGFFYGHQTHEQLAVEYGLSAERIRGIISTEVRYRQTRDAKAGKAHIAPAQNRVMLGNRLAYEVRALSSQGGKVSARQWITIFKPMPLIQAQWEADEYNRNQVKEK